MPSAKINEENEARAKAEQGPEEIRPKAKIACGFRHQMPVGKMLVGGEKFRVGGAGGGGSSGDGDGSVDVEGDRREADFVAARLVAQL
jgi:hypothetical protein